MGLLGGPLFGLASSLAAVGFDRRLLAEPRDLVVLAAYLPRLTAHRSPGRFTRQVASTTPRFSWLAPDESPWEVM